MRKGVYGLAPSGGHVLFFQGIPIVHLEATDQNAETLSVFGNSTVDARLLEKFPRVRYIATRTTGFDHVDINAVSARGGVVSNVPLYGEHIVAEFTFALILALSRKIREAARRRISHSTRARRLNAF